VTLQPDPIEDELLEPSPQLSSSQRSSCRLRARRADRRLARGPGAREADRARRAEQRLGAGAARAGGGPPPGHVGRPAGVAPPTNDLGPRFTLTYRLGPQGSDGTVVQDVHPYAKPEAVAYTALGQQFYAMRTRGGWHVRTSRRARPLLAILVEAGLPPRPPTRSGTASAPWSVVEWSALGGALLLVAVVAELMRRRAATTATRKAQTSTVTASRSASKTARSTSPRSSPSAWSGRGRSQTTSSRSASCA